MNKKTAVIVIMTLCIALLAGCSGQDKLVGVYRSDAAADTIILYKDGKCEYLGNDNAAWTVRGDTVTVTLQYPEHYYLDVYLDGTMLTDAEMRAVCTRLQTLENVYSCEYVAGSNMIRAELEKKDSDGRTAAAVSQIEGVINAEPYTWKPDDTNHELTVMDGCLVKEMSGEDIVFVKAGS